MRCRPDSGFSLVEVVIATTVLGVLAATTGLFFVGGIRGSAELQHRQLATSIANQALELAGTVTAQPAAASDCRPLLAGRTQTAVTAQWATAPAGVDLSTTDPAWTPSSCTAATSVPLEGLTLGTPAVTRGGVDFTIRTYIGSCSLPATGGTCVRAAVAPSGSTTMYRVIVAVSWKGTGCVASACLYTLSTLVDSTPDPLFNLRSATVPIAAADVVCTPMNVRVLFSLLSNDGGPLGPTPVTIVQSPSHGSIGSRVESGSSSFTPTANFSGTDGFSYFLTSVSGVQSATAQVTVKIGITC